MSITKVIPVKPHYDTYKFLAKLFKSSKANLIKRNIISLVVCGLEDLALAKNVISLTDEKCEYLELAPIEASRFASALVMAIQESLTIDLPLTDGTSTDANLKISVDRKKLEKAFSIYASGSFRRKALKKHLGEDLLLLLPDNEQDRPDNYSTTFEFSFTLDDSTLTSYLNQTHSNTDNFITRHIRKLGREVLQAVNQSINTN